MATNGDLVDNMVDRIKMQSKETHTDEMWFAIAIKIRLEGAPWSEMQKYGVDMNGNPLIKDEPVIENCSAYCKDNDHHIECGRITDKIIKNIKPV